MSLSAVLERSRRDKESWRYTDLATLLKRPPLPVAAAQSQLPSIVTDATQRHRIVFANGVLQRDATQLQDMPSDILQGDVAEGYRLILAGQTCLVTAPIELVYLTDKPAADSSLRLAIDIGANARLTIIEHHVAIGAAVAAQMPETIIRLGAQSKLVHGKILHSGAVHLARNTVHVAEGAYYSNFALIKNTGLVRNEIDVTLAGKLSQCALDGVMLLRGQDHADTSTRIVHAAPHGSSRQLYKSVVTERAHGVFQGKIKVAKDAQKTDGRQLSRALLLSDQAEMDAKPELEIDADDVSCSHGSTIGDLNAEALFYLRARGLPEQEARALLLRGFIDEAIDEIHVDEWRNYARAEAERWLNEQG